MNAVKRYPVLVAMFLGAVFMVLPLLIVLVNALKSPAEYSANGPLSLPDGLYLDGLKDFWTRVDFGNTLLNSVLISGSVAVFGVILSVLNAYAIGIGRIKGKAYFLAFFVLANVLPQEALVYPLYYLSKEVGLYDTRLSLIIVFSVVQAAFGTYLLSSVLGAFPRRSSRRPGSTAPTAGRSCGAWWSRSAGPPSASCWCSSSSGPGTSSCCRWSCCRRTTIRPSRWRSACSRASG